MLQKRNPPGCLHLAQVDYFCTGVKTRREKGFGVRVCIQYFNRRVSALISEYTSRPRLPTWKLISLSLFKMAARFFLEVFFLVAAARSGTTYRSLESSSCIDICKLIRKWFQGIALLISLATLSCFDKFKFITNSIPSKFYHLKVFNQTIQKWTFIYEG